MPEPLILNPADNVAILTEKGIAPAGHKIARRPIPKGDEVVKYGQVIGYATEVIEVWFADELSLGDRQLDEGEFLDVFAASQDELEQWMLSGKLTDAKTIVGMMWLRQWRAGQCQLDWVAA